METAAHNLQVAPPLRPVRNLETERLCDEFYERASDALERLHPPVMMNLEETNGFLTALACESSFADPEDYIDVIAGEDFVDSSSDEAYAEFTDLLSGQMDLIRRVLANNEVFFPVLLPDENGQLKGNDWAQGFARALAGSGLWDRLMDDKDHWQLLSPMLVLDTERHPLSDEPPRPPISSEQRKDLIALLSVAVMKIYKYFESERLKEDSEAKKFSTTLPPINPSERSDLARMDELLTRLKPAGALDLEALDGFLIALSCGPSILDLADAIAPILGDVEEGALPESELREICDLIVRRYNEIGEFLDDGRLVRLVVRNDSSPKLYAEEWVRGFTLAMGMDAEDWKVFLESKDYSKALMPLFLLDPQAQQLCSLDGGEFERLRDSSQRRALLSAIPASVMVVDGFFGPQRLAWDDDPEPPMPIQRTTPKQGRNDPCACGSGKKYKRCCGE